jgi:hypothetical protein
LIRPGDTTLSDQGVMERISGQLPKNVRQLLSVTFLSVVKKLLIIWQSQRQAIRLGFIVISFANFL